MPYHIKILDRAEREARIKQGLDASVETEQFFDFRDAKIPLKVVRVPIDLPVYRMENFRTFSEQAEYVARERKAADVFRTGQENESVQQVQHDILVKLARKAQASSGVAIMDVLERDGQRETLLITHRGVVVNGNRRLAAMRELISGDLGANQQFSHVTCKVLPADTTPSDILVIEGILQARPETRLDYDWIGDAQLLSAMLKMKGTPEAVSQVLGRRVSDIKNALRSLSEADIYLRDWAKAEGEYNRVVEDGQQLFRDLPGEIEGKSSSLQDASRALAWTLFDNRREVDGRLYNYNVVFGKRAEDVLERLSDDLGVPLDTEPTTDSTPYDFDVGEESGAINYQPLIAALKDGSRKAAVFEALSEIAVSVVESEKDKKSQSAALKAVSAANAKLAEVDLTRAARETYEAIERQLASIMDRAAVLSKKVGQLRSQPSPPDDGVDKR